MTQTLLYKTLVGGLMLCYDNRYFWLLKVMHQKFKHSQTLLGKSWHEYTRIIEPVILRCTLHVLCTKSNSRRR